MKRLIAMLAALLILPCTAFAESGIIAFDERFHVTYYDCAEMPDGRLAVSMSVRDKENRKANENPSAARLVCVGTGGAEWDVIYEKGDINIYGGIAALEDGALLVVYHHYKEGTGFEEWELHKYSSSGELIKVAALSDILPQGEQILQLHIFSFGAVIYSYIEGGSSITKRFVTVADEQLNRVSRSEVPPVQRYFLPEETSGAGESSGLIRLWRDGAGFDILNSKHEALWSYDASSDLSGRVYLLGCMDGIWLGEHAMDKSTRSIAGPYTVLRISPEGERLGKFTLELPETDERNVLIADSLVTDDAIYLLLSARTDTCIRLLRFDLEGRLTGMAEHMHEDHEHLAHQLVRLGGKMYCCANVTYGDRDFVELIPLDIEEAN